MAKIAPIAFSSVRTRVCVCKFENFNTVYYKGRGWDLCQIIKQDTKTNAHEVRQLIKPHKIFRKEVPLFFNLFRLFSAWGRNA